MIIWRLCFGILVFLLILIAVWRKRVRDAQLRAEYVAAWHARTRELRAEGKCLHCRGDGETYFLVTCTTCRGSGYDPTKIRKQVEQIGDAMEYPWEEAERRGARVCKHEDA